MLSSLIWGSSKDANPKADSDGRIGQAEENGHTEVHAISDDDEEDEKSNVEPAPARWTAQQKGKGRSPSPTYRSQGPGRLTSSHTFGDLRSAHRDFDDITPDTTPAQSPKKRSNAEMDEPKSPADVNSALANFFAGKGSQTLTADERRHVATLLQQGPPTSGYSETSSAGPASPKFTFAIPSPARPTTTAAVSDFHISVLKSDDLRSVLSFWLPLITVYQDRTALQTAGTHSLAIMGVFLL